jgi:hypothetical protein
MSLEFILPLFLLIFLLLPPWHNDGEYGVISIGKIANSGNSILQKRHRMPLGLENVLLLILLVTSAPRAMIDLLLHHQCRLLIFLLASEKLMERGLPLDSCIPHSHSFSTPNFLHFLITIIVLNDSRTLTIGSSPWQIAAHSTIR